MDDKTSIEDIRKAVAKIPLLSVHAQRLLQVSATADHELADVIDIVKCDAAMTAKVLRVVNSAAYDLLNPITSIDRAVSYLGERMVTCIAIGESAGKLLNKPMGGYDAAAGDLWKHDLFTAIASREVARYIKADVAIDLAFTGGLLHDIGKAIITDFLNGSAEDLVGDIARGDLQNYLNGEKNLLGLDHAEIGMELAEAWDLPSSLKSTIAYHHHPMDAPEQDRGLVYAVHLGDIIAMMSGYGTGSDCMQYQLDPEYQEYLDLTTEHLPVIMMEAEEQFQKAEASMTQNQEDPS